MSNKLKKNSAQKRTRRYLGINQKLINQYNKKEAEDKAMLAVSTSICWMTYLALYDLLGFKEKRLRKFYSMAIDMKVKWHDDACTDITTEAMQNYCIAKKIKYQDWIRSIPEVQKRALCPVTITTNEGIRYLDAVILANILPMVVILKEEFRVSTKKVNEVLDKIKHMIGCYAVRQPRCKKPYLDDQSIIAMFKEELKLNLETGERVA
ncbi:hypothetical protein [Jingyaoa shaoxingensis]|uniref:Uncharacterized protein n=1 Tax=Jingyaoa shaoxingensis TaxID=2763671 RepID=A0ABR7NDH9_9FIRM|nr:hypothetical protein [Jingyaoa shaoxingensis]MBC8574456.1 hypothetical protein [Jingyaoa shaoxingensis]